LDRCWTMVRISQSNQKVMIDGKKVLGIIPARGGSKGVTRKNINSKKAISAIEPAFTSGDDLLAINYFLLFIPNHNIDPLAISIRE